MDAPFVSHSDTSREAAERISPANKMRAQVLAVIKVAGHAGMTDEEVQTALAMNPSTQRPRRIELVQRGLVFDTGDWRLTKSGRKATVWAAA